MRTIVFRVLEAVDIKCKWSTDRKGAETSASYKPTNHEISDTRGLLGRCDHFSLAEGADSGNRSVWVRITEIKRPIRVFILIRPPVCLVRYHDVHR